MKKEMTSDFRVLYKFAYYCSILMLVLVPIQVIVFILSPPPDTTLGFFELYQESALLGLLSLDLIYLFSNLILIPLYIALGLIFYKYNPSYIIMAIFISIISLSSFYPSNPAIEMLTLSKQYFQAAPQENMIYITAAESLLAGYTGTAYVAYYILGAITLLLFSYTIFKSNAEYKSIGLWGLLSGVFMLIPASFGIVGMTFSLLSLIPWCVFVYLLVGKFKELSVK